MSDVWKANCEKAPIDTVRLLRELDGGIYLLAKQADRGCGVALSPASCRSLCAWLTERGFGPEVHAPPAQVDEREQQAAVHGDRIAALEAICAAQQKRIDDLTERFVYLENWRVRMLGVVRGHDDRITVLEKRMIRAAIDDANAE